MEQFDVLVIGGGPGGYVAAIQSALAGKKTAVIEKENLGGVCLNWGCIPTKALLRNAEIVRYLSEGDFFGFTTENTKADYKKAQERSREVSARLVKGIAYLMKKDNIAVYKAEAVFTGPKEVQVDGKKLTAEHMIIAAGSRPFPLPVLDYSEKNILDSKGALQLTAVPESIVIIGAGAIGMEFATVFSSYGAKVTVVEMMERVLPNEDREVSALMEKEYKKQGVDICTGTKVTKVENDGKTARVTVEKDGKSREISCACVLGATGIKPNTDLLGLQKYGYKTDRRGYLEVDDRMRTNVQGVYAIGDINGKLALAHTASAQAGVAVADICKKPVTPIHYHNIPRCTFGKPECASAGLTEDKAREQGYDVKTAVFPFSAIGKAIAYGEDAGFVKLVFDKKYGELLGVHMVGAHVTEMIAAAVGYLGLEVTVDELAGIIHPHPTMSEAIMEAAHVADGHPIHI